MTQRAQCTRPGCDKPAKFIINRPGEPDRYACEDDVADDILARNEQVPA